MAASPAHSTSSGHYGENTYSMEELPDNLRALLPPKVLDMYDTEVVPVQYLVAMQRVQEKLEKKEKHLESEIKKIEKGTAQLVELQQTPSTRASHQRRLHSLAQDIEMCKQTVASKQEEFKVLRQKAANHLKTVMDQKEELAPIISKMLRSQSSSAPVSNSTALAFRNLMNNVDAAAHVVSFMTTKEALTGLVAVSREFIGQIDKDMTVLKFYYVTDGQIPALTRFPKVRHLMIKNTGGAACLEGLAAISASLESLRIEVNSSAIAKSLNALAFPNLKHLHVGKVTRSLFETNFVRDPAAFPLLETFAMTTLDLELGGLLEQGVYPQLKRLAFEATHPLCGGEPWYLDISEKIYHPPWWGGSSITDSPRGIEILLKFPQTPCLRLRYSRTLNELVPQEDLSIDGEEDTDGGGLTHLTHLAVKNLVLDDPSLGEVVGTLQHLEVVYFTDINQSRCSWFDRLPPGSFSALRKFVVKYPADHNFLVNILRTATGAFDELHLGQVDYQLQKVADRALTAPSLTSIKRSTFQIMGRERDSPSLITREIRTVLSRMTSLEELEVVFWHGDARMDFFLCRLITMKEDGYLPHLKLLNLVDGRRQRYGSQWDHNDSTCTTPMALLLLLWLHEEANGCARGLRVPYIPLPRGNILMRMLQAARGDGIGKGVKIWAWGQ